MPLSPTLALNLMASAACEACKEIRGIEDRVYAAMKNSAKNPLFPDDEIRLRAAIIGVQAATPPGPDRDRLEQSITYLNEFVVLTMSGHDEQLVEKALKKKIEKFIMRQKILEGANYSFKPIPFLIYWRKIIKERDSGSSKIDE